MIASIAAAVALSGCATSPQTKAMLNDALAYRIANGSGYYPARQTAMNGMQPTTGSGLGSGNVQLNAYGLGMGMDQYGRAVPHDPMLQVTPNAYGLGVGMDHYGRQVR
ncbi:hypothetical protein CU102_12510 [Phyllobacterium brassicacearum]|uniref:Uncharacterized protein n=2 Tax=Phyllobacterium brassicacearum TaxID=314235 RepID=A0A2P7BQ40_9HYPH|nr:hypothetical protein CU102_12510 [Phyllobacterium brassicacearum]